jgi:hypothetical protein
MLAEQICEQPHCDNPAEDEYRIRGSDEVVWLCDSCLRLAKIADSEDGTVE